MLWPESISSLLMVLHVFFSWEKCNVIRMKRYINLMSTNLKLALLMVTMGSADQV